MSSTAIAPASPSVDFESYPTEWNNAIQAGVMRDTGTVPRSRAALDQAGAPKGARFFASKRPGKGSFMEARLDLAATWGELTETWEAYMKYGGWNPVWTESRDADDKKDTYDFQPKIGHGSDNYPPHLDTIPKKDQVSKWTIFDTFRLADTGGLLTGLIPRMLYLNPAKNALSIKDIEANTHKFEKEVIKGVYGSKTIGDRSDWFTDRIWAQQMFTGTNPMIITAASSEWIRSFTDEAKQQALNDVIKLIESTKTRLYVADYSYFREAASNPDGSQPISATATLQSDPDPKDREDTRRYACASVGLFNLNTEGQLHPIAICLDYKGSMAASVTIFNKHLNPGEASVQQEADDWPWRYAKTCLSVADWIHHELKVHLTDTHLTEEVIIVATHRSFNDDDLIFKLLEPHWVRTLSLNAAARESLVPDIICKIAGISTKCIYNYINNVYTKKLDFQGLYVPNDLRNRGFPPEALNDPKHPDHARFHNYTYARNMQLSWQKLRNFVSSYLKAEPNSYDQDEAIANDPKIENWCREMRSADRGNMATFPEIKTRDQLVDALTMCIHIASTQHTAINYLQQYYYSFVINRPPALYTPLPTKLSALQSYTEQDLFDSMPCNHPKDWLLASHLPWLLSYKVASNQNLTNYAKTLRHKTTNPKIQKAADQLGLDLTTCQAEFKKHNEENDIPGEPYTVLDPDSTALSILI